MKRLGYYLFNIFYYIFYLIPTNSNKLVLIMTHDESPEGNVLYAANYFKEQNPNLFFKKIKKEDYEFKFDKSLLIKLVRFFIFSPYDIATSKMIFLDNIFLPFAYTKFKKDVAIVQLWHGTGTIKKFALDSEKDLIKKLAEKSSSKNTHLIVGSEQMVPIYKSAFKMSEDKIFPIGSPRTDLFFDEDFIKNKKREFYKRYPELLNKRIILYAPTFRDDEFKKEILMKKDLNLDDYLNLNLDIFKILEFLDEEYVLLLRLHPAIAKNFSIDNLHIKNTIKNRIYDFSDFNSLNTLMFISNCLISDYSSIIFEYSLLNKKMIFYPYDLEDFENYSRSFYFNYENFVPGPIIRDINEISENISDDNIDNLGKKFKEKYMKRCDGESVKRFYSLLKNFKK